MPTTWTKSHLLDIQSLSSEEILVLLDAAKEFKGVGQRDIKKVPALRGKTVVNLFIENSTRTRISFELAALRLSADVIHFDADVSSLKKGESLKDTVRNLEALNADFIILRHSASGAPHFLARFSRAHIVNAGDGSHEHPSQGLLDVFTIREHRAHPDGTLRGLKVSIIGDILFSRVARSDVWALTKLGAEVTLCGPSTLVPQHFERMGCRITHRIEEALEGADVVNFLRIQQERQSSGMFPSTGEFASLFGLTVGRARRLKPDCLIMHPGPINRGVELESELADGAQSVILEQVTNGLAIRMAILYLLNGTSTI